MTQTTLYTRANRCLVGGVSSPVRAFGAVGGEPIFFEQGQGAHLIAHNGDRYLDYVCSWGANIVGHAHPQVIQTLGQRIEQGLGFGAPSEIEVLLAETLLAALPGFEVLRMVNSGTEATMTAIRLARGATGRDKFIKFAGCYHGHADPLLIKAGSGALTFGTPNSEGVPIDLAQHTLVADYNDLETVQQLFEQYGQQIAGIIVEPIAGNMNMILPQAGFLQGLRALCDAHQSLLIFDEVMSGFRVAKACAYGFYQVQPDIITLGKVIGGGLPAAAIAGKRTVMEHLAPTGSVYQAGTLSGNPIAMAAGLASMKLVLADGFFEQLELISQHLCEGLRGLGQQHGIPLTTCAMGGMLGIVFSEREHISCFDDVANSNLDRFKQFFHALLAHNIYLPPSPYEACFLNAAHTKGDVEHTLNAVDDILAHLK